MEKFEPVNQSVEIGKKLKEYFDKLGYTQQYVADKLGVSQAAVSALLNGKPFGKKLATKWAEVFGLKPNWLLTGEGEMFKENTTETVIEGITPTIIYEMLVKTGERIANAVEEIANSNKTLADTNAKLVDTNQKLVERILELTEKGVVAGAKGAAPKAALG